MDKLDQLISEKQAELERLKNEIETRGAQYERILIEVEALKVAAKARPGSRATGSNNATGPHKPKERRNGRRKGGRSAGDISQEWRKVLGAARALHRRLSYADINEIAVEAGIRTKMPNVRERVRSMTENGLLTGTPENGFLVTAEAVSRFGLDKAQAA